MEVKTATTNSDGEDISSAAKGFSIQGSNKHELDTQGITYVTKVLEERKVVLRMLQVPLKDSFGITEAFQEVASLEEKSEVLASQSFVGFHQQTIDGSELQTKDGMNLFVDTCLRKDTKNVDCKGIMNALVRHALGSDIED